MRDFHATWYQPQSITAVVVGNLPVEELIQIVADGFTEAISDRQPRLDSECYQRSILNYLYRNCSSGIC